MNIGKKSNRFVSYGLTGVFLIIISGLINSQNLFAAAPNRVEFNRDIRPILSDKCFFCHGPDEKQREADLRFDTAQGIKIDLGGYHAAVPGKPEKSAMIERILSDDEDERMPPADVGKPLSKKEIELIRKWIKQGAVYQDHWSFVSPKRPTVPKVKQTNWPVNQIDRFILARLESKGFKPSARADKVTLVRRLYFDLIGLPPTQQEVQQFVNDRRADAYEQVVDRLLKSEHYGERMAIYWLDLVRYADTVGYHGDQPHSISPYRDYVITAFNDNMPFDQFTREQLAGDLIPKSTLDQKIASGYNRLLQTTHEGGAQDKEYLAKYASDRVRNLSEVWMGATMGCCECHDHKFDPYTTKDFYSMQAFFADIKEKGFYAGSRNALPTTRPPQIQVLSIIDRKHLAKIQKKIIQINQQIQKIEKTVAQGKVVVSIKLTATNKNQLKVLKAELAKLKKTETAIQKNKRWTMITQEVKPRVIRILPRGDWLNNKGKIVQPSIPDFLKSKKAKKTNGKRLTRLDLANWLTSKNHPQTSRVFVNRLWYLYFGSGLSKHLSDNGSQGQWPTHPKLLDYLAVEFSEHDWDIKRMVKMLVMSSTYRQSSLETKQMREIDPENRLYSHQSRFRLPAEMIRDNALSISGLLVHRLGGRSVKPYQPSGYYANLNFPRRKYKQDNISENLYRRGVYTHWQRQFLHPMLRSFDAPTREECTSQRPISNTPLAALTLLNDPTFVEAARVFAQRIMKQGGKDDTEKIIWAWQQTLSRKPQQAEIRVLLKLLKSQQTFYRSNLAEAKKLITIGNSTADSSIKPQQLAAWTIVARTLLNLNETIMRN